MQWTREAPEVGVSRMRPATAMQKHVQLLSVRSIAVMHVLKSLLQMKPVFWYDACDEIAALDETIFSFDACDEITALDKTNFSCDACDESSAFDSQKPNACDDVEAFAEVSATLLQDLDMRDNVPGGYSLGPRCQGRTATHTLASVLATRTSPMCVEVRCHRWVEELEQRRHEEEEEAAKEEKEGEEKEKEEEEKAD